MTASTLADWLVVSAVSGLGPTRVQQLLKHLSLSELRWAIEHRPSDLPRSVQSLTSLTFNPAKVDSALTWLEVSAEHYIICLDDDDYPSLLREIADPPTLLFVKGDPMALALPSLAMVGSRDATPAGLKHSYEFAKQLVEAGIMVTSGLAAGIDGAAHSGALAARTESNYKTLAVLGTGVDEIYPKRHRSLYQEIQTQGCIISEYWPDTRPYAGNFPKRNRIISGLSLGTLVVEASRRSGSLITARMAMEQGRDVFALPGSILSHQSQGCHDLIQQGAKLTCCVDDILQELPNIFSHHLEESKKQHHIGKEAQPDLPFSSLLASVGYETTTIDVIVEHSGIAIDLVLEQLLELELQGWVATVPGGYVKLKRS
ncbi:DNA-protecting protein DprA [Parashewanella curva]|uniref:DNA-protecting protein DprA n=1 Tax=Parashewanella curva TaxID=2338552 RepID=A0A3L8PZT6_9GAMM|nr:DNA-processing protein DprA [Parashewanella curva]RLV60894.1 DNA-protecting protein DprA [Parashewanella curva]